MVYSNIINVGINKSLDTDGGLANGSVGRKSIHGTVIRLHALKYFNHVGIAEIDLFGVGVCAFFVSKDDFIEKIGVYRISGGNQTLGAVVMECSDGREFSVCREYIV